MPGYISEFLHEGGVSSDFVEVWVPHGTDVSTYSVVLYDKDGTVNATVSLGNMVTVGGGGDIYLIDSTSPGLVDIMPGDAVALVDDSGTVLQFLSFDGSTQTATEGPAVGMTSTDVGNTSRGNSLQTDDGGSTYYAQAAPNPGTVPCYAPGTLIDTPDGPRAVETLQPGDLVMTLDHGPQTIRWTRSGEHPLEEAEVDAKPVQIKAGALGRNLPAHDLIVSPQHRMLVGGAGQLDGVFANEAFAPAKSLTSVPGIRHMKGKARITWIHFACDRHEVVVANGCLSESLLLGPIVVNGLSPAERQTLVDIFGPAPTPDAALNGPPARDCLKVGAVRRQIAKYLKEKGQLLAKEIKKWDRDLAMERYEAERMREAQSLAQFRKNALRVA